MRGAFRVSTATRGSPVRTLFEQDSENCFGASDLVALARAHLWKEGLNSGRFRSIQHIADTLGVDGIGAPTRIEKGGTGKR